MDQIEKFNQHMTTAAWFALAHLAERRLEKYQRAYPSMTPRLLVPLGWFDHLSLDPDHGHWLHVNGCAMQMLPSDYATLEICHA